MCAGDFLPRFAVSLFLFISSISAASSAWSADDPLKATLQARYAAMKAAMAAHDGTAMAAILAPNFASIDVSGKSEPASRMIAELNALKPDPNKVSETTLTSVTRSGNVATVEQRYDMKTVRTTDDGAQNHIEVVAVSTDSWIKRDDVWLLEQTVTNELSYFKDGQLIAHKMRQ